MPKGDTARLTALLIQLLYLLVKSVANPQISPEFIGEDVFLDQSESTALHQQEYEGQELERVSHLSKKTRYLREEQPMRVRRNLATEEPRQSGAQVQALIAEDLAHAGSPSSVLKADSDNPPAGMPLPAFHPRPTDLRSRSDLEGFLIRRVSALEPGDRTHLEGVEASRDAEYGAHCAAWNSIELECQPEGERFQESWCESVWCWVPEACAGRAASPNYTDPQLYSSSVACPRPPPPRVACCDIILDDDYTCTTTTRLYGNVAVEGLNDSPEACVQFCMEEYPDAKFTDFFPNVDIHGWCNCYYLCDDRRCVSEKCFGKEGGGVLTQEILTTAPSPPPVLPPPPHVALPPPPPLYPDSPNLGHFAHVGNLSEVNITIEDTEYAAGQVQSAIEQPALSRINLYTNVSVTWRAGGELGTVNRSLLITGHCQTLGTALCEIDGSHEYRLFSVAEGGALTLEALVLHAGFTEGCGGALNVEALSRAVLRGCVLEGNTATKEGGATAYAVLERGHGGGEKRAQYSGGGIAPLTGSVLIMRDVALHNNTCEVNGGGVYNYNGNLSLAYSNVTENQCGARGGGLMCYKQCYFELTQDTLIVANHANESGGGIYGHSGTVLVTNSGTKLMYNSAGVTQWNGAGVYLYEGCSMTAHDTEVAYNHAMEYGGGMYFNTKTTVVLGPGTWIHHNHAEADGGGIFMSSESNFQMGPDVIVSHNQAVTGGGLYLIESTLDMQSSSVLNNTA
ncbi:hypothetical protein CYMTET_20814, partial [Cymbomonas tetramitiformis]